ncbi:MAG: SH3 domain-containing protein [Eubacteriales bacterium]|nr:SH3 domain-containing protein [Eubacteriales bacterium]
MNDFREWISDNLRYLILGFGVFVVLVILVVGIKSCSKTVSTTSSQTVEESDEQAASDDTDADAAEYEEPLTEDDASLLDLIRTYYQALGNRDGNALSSVVENMTSSDVTAMINANNYITGYDVEHVYSKSGLTEGTYVVYVKYNYSCADISAKVPAFSQMYVVTSADGSLKIKSNTETDAEIAAYITKVTNNSDVRKLYSDAENEYNQVISSNPDLEVYLNGMGEASNASSGNQTRTAKEECNVREAASTDSDVIGGLSEGDEVEVLGQEGDWVKISYDGQEAYVFGELLN